MLKLSFASCGQSAVGLSLPKAGRGYDTAREEGLVVAFGKLRLTGGLKGKFAGSRSGALAGAVSGFEGEVGDELAGEGGAIEGLGGALAGLEEFKFDRAERGLDVMEVGPVVEADDAEIVGHLEAFVTARDEAEGRGEAVVEGDHGGGPRAQGEDILHGLEDGAFITFAGKIGDGGRIDAGGAEGIVDSFALGAIERGVVAGEEGDVAMAELEEPFGLGARRLALAEIDTGPGETGTSREDVGDFAVAEDFEVLLRHAVRHDDDSTEIAGDIGAPIFRGAAEQRNCGAEGRHDGLGPADHFGEGAVFGGLRALHKEPDVAMDLGGAAVGKGALTMFAENEATILEIAQSQTDGYPADLEPAAKLMLAGNRKRVRFRAAEDFLR